MQEKKDIAQKIHNAFSGEQHYVGTELRRDTIIVYVDSRALCEQLAPSLKQQFNAHVICAYRNRPK